MLAVSALTALASPAFASQGALLGIVTGHVTIAIVAIHGQTYHLHIGSRFAGTRVVNISEDSVTLADGSTIGFSSVRLSSSPSVPETRQPRSEMQAQNERAPSVVVNIYQAAPSTVALPPAPALPGYDASYFTPSNYFTPSLITTIGCTIKPYIPNNVPSAAGHPNGPLFSQPGALPGLFQIPKPSACS